MRASPARRSAVAAFAVLVAALAALVAWTTPWSVLPAHIPGGAAPTDAAHWFTAAQRARENAFHAAVHPPAYAGLLVSLAVTVALGVTPAGVRLADALARPLRGHWAARAGLGGAAVVAAGWAAGLPFGAWAHTVERRYGLTAQGWGGWLSDQGRSLLVAVVPAVVALLVLVALARRLPRGWWLPAAGLAGGLVLLVSFGYPVVVEPLFNHFRPLAAGPLRTSLLDLARRDGVPVHEVLVADASRRTTTLNAYVSGYGDTRRIVLYDTLLRSASPAEIRLVVAHELGHAKEDDVLHGTVEGAVGSAAGVVLLYLVLCSPRVRRSRTGSGLRDGRPVALAVAVVTVLTTLAVPLQSLVSRHIEARADYHALQLTRDPATFQASMRRLALTGLTNLDPSAFVYVWFTDHPTPPQRLAMAADWARLHGAR